MSVPRLTPLRIVLAVVVIWFALGLISLVQFHAGGTVPGDGRGEKLELSKQRD